MAKKTDKALKDLTKELKKLRTQNDKLAAELEKTREDQAGSHQEILALLEDRLPTRDAEPEEPQDRSTDSGVEEGPEVTDAAARRAKELGVDPSGVKGTGSGGRVLVWDVEAAAK